MDEGAFSRRPCWCSKAAIGNRCITGEFNSQRRENLFFGHDVFTFVKFFLVCGTMPANQKSQLLRENWLKSHSYLPFVFRLLAKQVHHLCMWLKSLHLLGVYLQLMSLFIALCCILGCLLAVEAIPLHFTFFSKLWMEVYQKAGDVCKRFLF